MKFSFESVEIKASKIFCEMYIYMLVQRRLYKLCTGNVVYIFEHSGREEKKQKECKIFAKICRK